MAGIVIVTAAQDRRRAGRRFRKGQPVQINTGDLGKGEMALLEADPLLVISSKAAADKKPAAKSAPKKPASKSGARKPAPNAAAAASS